MSRHQRSQSAADPQQESSASASLRAQLQKSASSPSVHKGKSRPRSTSSSTAADSGVSIKSKPDLTARDWYYKGRPKTQVYKGHAVSYTSEYTRPAADLMQEILVRYPEPPPSKTVRYYGVTEQGTDGEGRPLLMTTLPRNRGWLDELRRYGGMLFQTRRGLCRDRPGRRDGQAGNVTQ